MRFSRFLPLLLLPTLLLFAAEKPAKPSVFTGEIEDSQCGFDVHSTKRSHEEMLKTGAMGTTNEDCTRICIEKMGGAYVFVTKDMKHAYKLDNQPKAREFAGHTVNITGTLDKTTNTLHIQSITRI